MNRREPSKWWLVGLPAIVIGSGLIPYPILTTLKASRSDAWLVAAFTLAMLGHATLRGSQTFPRGGVWDLAAILAVFLVIGIVGLGFVAAPRFDFALLPLALCTWLSLRLRSRFAEVRRHFAVAGNQGRS